MASGIQTQDGSVWRDLDDVFEPIGAGQAYPENTNIQSTNGVDLRFRYRKAVDGSKIGYDTGLQAWFINDFSATDLTDVFAAKGSVATGPIWTAGTLAQETDPGGTANAGFSFQNTGAISLFPSGTDGDWYGPTSEGGISDYRIKWVQTGSFNGAVPTASWTENTWTSLSNTQSLSLTTSGPEKEIDATVTIERISTGQTVSRSITIFVGTGL